MNVYAAAKRRGSQAVSIVQKRYEDLPDQVPHLDLGEEPLADEHRESAFVPVDLRPDEPDEPADDRAPRAAWGLHALHRGNAQTPQLPGICSGRLLVPPRRHRQRDVHRPARQHSAHPGDAGIFVEQQNVAIEEKRRKCNLLLHNILEHTEVVYDEELVRQRVHFPYTLT
jgi:hypothetical protein